MPSRLSQGRRAEIVRLYKQGLSRLKVAAQTGAAIETVTKVLKEQGVPIRPPYEKFFTPAAEQDLVVRYQGGATIANLSTVNGCTIMTIHKVLRKHGITLRDDRGRTRHYTEGEVTTIRQMATDGQSQATIAKAVGSSQETVSKLMRSHNIAPGRRGPSAGEHHSRWKGGRMVRQDGYVAVKVQPNAPFASMRDRAGYALEHRLVMASSLGRPLEPFEEVHHVNGQRADNALENLQLRRGKHGGGGPYQCADCGSLNIVSVKIT